jgi:hypothetical protein
MVELSQVWRWLARGAGVVIGDWRVAFRGGGAVRRACLIEKKATKTSD